MPRSAIPDFGIDYPPWEYQPFPKHVGLDKDGEPLTAKDQKEYDELLPDVVFPKLMGKDKAGKDVIAYIPRDLEWKKGEVATPPEDPAVAKKREEDHLAAIAETERKAKAYDELMAKGNGANAGSSLSQVDAGKAANNLTAAKPSQKTKAA